MKTNSSCQKLLKRLLLMLATLTLSTIFAATTHAAVLSGTAYSDAGVTAMPDGTNITILQNGADVGLSQVLANGDGTFSIDTAPTLIAPDDIITVYLDSGDGVGGLRVTKQNAGDADITGLDIFQDHLIATHEGPSALSVTELETAIPFALSSSDTDVSAVVGRDNLGGTIILASGSTFIVEAGKGLSGDQNFTAHNTTINGTLVLATSTFQVTGNLVFGVAGDVSSAGSSTFTIGGSTDQSITINNAAGLNGASTVMLISKFGGVVNFTTEADLGDIAFRMDNSVVNMNDNNLTARLFILNDGTFNAGGADIDITGFNNGASIDVNDGTFNHGSGAVTTVLDLHLDGGDFGHGSGLVDLGGDIDVSDASSTYTGTTGELEIGNLNLTFGEFIVPDTMRFSSSLLIDDGTTFNANDSTITKQFGADGFIQGDAATVTVNNFETNRPTNIRDDLSAGRQLIIQGNLTLTDDLATIHSNGTGNIIFSGTSSQAITTTAGSQNGINVPVTLNKTNGTVTLQNNLQLDEAGQTLTITDGNLDLEGSDLAVDTTITVGANGELTLFGDETVSPNPTFDSSSSVTFDGAAGAYNIPDWSYPAITFGSGETFNLPDNPTIGSILNFAATVISGAGDYTISGLVNVGTFTAPAAATLTITTGVTNGGTFNHNNGTVEFSGASNAVGGSLTLFNLVKEDSANDGTNEELQVQDGQTITVLNDLTLTGLDINDLVTLVSSNPGTAWDLDPQGTRSLQFVIPTDVNNIDPTVIDCTNGCVDGGNNTNWSFQVQNNGGGGGGGSSAFALLNLGSTNTEGAPQEDPVQPEAENPEFDKLEDIIGHWAYFYIQELFQADIMKGRDEKIFAPNEQMTRAEFIKVALLAYGYIPSEDSAAKALDLGFSDLTPGQWYLGYMYEASSKGFIEGFTDGNEKLLKPNQPVTRAEALTILARVANWDLEDLGNNTTEFPDVSKSDWFYAVVKKAVGMGIVSGYESGEFGPLDTLLRAQAAKMVANLI
jgi:hypothetical protein